MNLPFATALFIGCLAALRALCWLTAFLLVLLALRAQFDETIALNSLQSVALAAFFAGLGWLAQWLRRYLTQPRSP